MSYQIKLGQGKYLITNDNGSLTILRGGKPWPAAEELKHSKIVLCLAQRIEELEMAIGAVVDGSLDSDERRREDGTSYFLNRYSPPQLIHVKTWDIALRNVLKQGE